MPLMERPINRHPKSISTSPVPDWIHTKPLDLSLTLISAQY